MHTISSRQYTHETYGWRVIELTNNTTRLAFVPEKGCNIISWVVDGVDYLCDGTMRRGKPAILGTPILYPTPNRVADAKFPFDGMVYQFTPNMRNLFIHGLVREIPWQVDEPVIQQDAISVRARIAFEPGSALHTTFPIANCLELVYTVTEGKVRIEFMVTNQDETKRLPFGLAIHPYFRIIGDRSQVRLQVPAEKYQEVIDLMPTGRLLDLGDAPADLNSPVAISELDLDAVYWGMSESRPQVIYYDAEDTKITLTADDFYKLSVIWTPTDAYYFGVENQSCSTDAHNMHDQGHTDLAHLAILDPGQTHRSWIELSVSDQ